MLSLEGVSTTLPTIVKSPSGTWKAVIGKTGFPTTVKTFRLKPDAEGWSRRTEDEMVRGLFLQRGPSERMTFEKAIKRYLAEVTLTKRPFTQVGEKRRAVSLTALFGKYSLAGITPELVAEYRDKRLAGEDRARDGKPRPRAGNTVRLELALIGHWPPSPSKSGAWVWRSTRPSTTGGHRPAKGAIGGWQKLKRVNSWAWLTPIQTP